MGLFRSRPSPAQLALTALQAENSDLRAQLRLERDLLRQEREQAALERQDLVDRIIALTHPPALREVRRTPPGESVPSPSSQQRSTLSISRLPPYPPRAGTPPTSSDPN